jgi:superfamily II DNA or RNA helicase
MELRPYQREAIEAVAASEASGSRSGLVVLPTGSGKTIIFATLAANAMGRTLILVHRDELVRQAVEKLHTVAPGLDVGIVQGGRNEHDRHIVVASVQTLARPKRLRQLRRNFSGIVTDEAHHAAANSYLDIYSHFRAGEDTGPYHLGVTATPARTDRSDLAEIFDAIVYEAEMRELIDQGYLCHMRGVSIDIGVNLDRVQVRGGDFKPEALSRAMIEANAPELIANAYADHGKGRRAIAFLPGVEVAERVSKSLCEAGIASAVVTGETPIGERQRIYEGLRSGSLSVVSSCLVLTEGFDEPSVDCIIIGRPTKSLPLYTQMVGRGSRPFPGKEDCLVIDVAGISHRHKIQSLSSLFGQPEALRPDAPAEIAQERVGERIGSDEEVYRINARFVDVELFMSSELAWVQTVEGHMTLALRDFSFLCATQQSEDWILTHIIKGEPEVVLGRGTFAGVETASIRFAKARDGGWHIYKEAWWRQQPASDKQRGLALSLGCDLSPRATKGEASDAIARLLNDRVISRARFLAQRRGSLTAVA